MIGYVDFAQLDIVSGWAFDPAKPDSAVILEVLVDGGVLGRTAANRKRPDVKAAGFGNGRVGFIFEFAARLSPSQPHDITVRTAETGIVLNGAPLQLAPTYQVQAGTIAGFHDAIDAVQDPDTRRHVIHTLVTAAERLRVMRDSRNQPGTRLRANGLPLALVIADAIPAPGDAVTAQLESLSRLGFRVIFVTTDLPGGTRHRAADLPVIAQTEFVTAADFASVEDVLQHFGNEVALAEIHGIADMMRYSALVRAHCGAARLVYRADEDDTSLRARVAARWADVVLATSAAHAATLRAAMVGLDVRVTAPDATPDELDAGLGKLVGSSKAPRVSRRASA